MRIKVNQINGNYSQTVRHLKIMWIQQSLNKQIGMQAMNVSDYEMSGSRQSSLPLTSRLRLIALTIQR